MEDCSLLKKELKAAGENQLEKLKNLYLDVYYKEIEDRYKDSKDFVDMTQQ